jgi:hypothetical protein
MIKKLIYLSLMLVLFLLSGCQYRKGKSFTWSGTADTLDYVIAASGSGKRVQEKISRLVWIHESKGDRCRVIYVSDSASIYDAKSIMLVYTVLPDYTKDMLTKGIMGTFATRQIITYLIVTQSDFEKSFTPSEK